MKSQAINHKPPSPAALLKLLNNTHDLIARTRELSLLPTGITPEQSDILTLIASADPKSPMTPSQLARLSLRRPHTMSGMLQRMLSADLIYHNKGSDPNHPNHVHITLTPRAKRYISLAIAHDLTVSNIFLYLQAEESSTLATLLAKLYTKALQEAKSLQPSPYSEPQRK